MRTYNLIRETKNPLYVTLYKCIKEDIEQQDIGANEKLPSKRELATHLGISVITVENAYAQLIDEGYIYSAERKGYFACEISGFFGKKAEINHEEKKGKEELLERKEETFFSEEKNMKSEMINICENAISNQKFPFSIWSRQMRQVISENYDSILDPIPNMGVYSLRQAISDYLYRFRGMKVDPKLILIGAGAENLYSVIIKLLGRNKIYGVENPGYKRISQIYSAEGVSMEYVPLDKFGLSKEILMEKEVEVIYTSPAHNFPTDIVMPVKRRMDILKWAHSKEGRYIIEDDYDSEFRFKGRPLPTMQSVDPLEKTIYMNTFSKTIAPSLRISYMILPPCLAKKYKEELGFYSCPVSGFEQHILAKFIDQGYFERHISRMRRHYAKERVSFIDLMKTSKLANVIKVREEMSGLHFIVNLKTEKTDEQIKEQAEKKGLRLSFVSDYSMSDNYISSSELIVNYSGVEKKDMNKAIDILAKII